MEALCAELGLPGGVDFDAFDLNNDSFIQFEEFQHMYAALTRQQQEASASRAATERESAEAALQVRKDNTTKMENGLLLTILGHIMDVTQAKLVKRGSKKKEIGRTAQIEGYMARAGVKELFAAALEAVLAHQPESPETFLMGWLAASGRYRTAGDFETPGASASPVPEAAAAAAPAAEGGGGGGESKEDEEGKE